MELTDQNKKQLAFTAVFVEDKEEGGYIAYLKEIDGISTQGETLEEAKENLIDAFHLAMEYKQEKFRSKKIMILIITEK